MTTRTLIVTVSAALTGFACTEPAPANPLEGTRWSVIQIEEAGEAFPVPPGADTPTLVLTREVVQDGVRRRLTGAGGCNNLGGSYRTPSSDSLRISALAITRKICPQEIIGFEIRLTRVLADVTRFEVADDALILSSDEGRISLRRADPPIA